MTPRSAIVQWMRCQSLFNIASIAVVAVVPFAVAAAGEGAASAPPSISVRDTALAEESAGIADAVFRLRLSRASPRTVSVRFATVAGSARAGADYVVRTGVVVFKPAQKLKQVRVRVLGDAVPEAEETFFLVLSRPRGAHIKTRRAIATIAANDLPPPFTLRAEMSGAEHVPPPGDPNGRGTVVLVLDAEREQVAYTITVSGMEVGESGLCQGARGEAPAPLLRLDYPPQPSGSKRLQLPTILEMFRAPEQFCTLARLDFTTPGIRGQLARAAS